MKSRLRSILLEMIPVILGVLIALFINNCKSNWDDKKYLKKTFNSINLELEENKLELSEILPKQYALIDTLELYIENSDLNLTDLIIKSNGIKLVSFRNMSWKSLLNNRIDLVEYSTISRLSEIEGTNEFMSLKTNKLMDYVNENLESYEEGSKKKLIIHLLNLIDTEEDLLRLHNDFLASE